MENSSSEDSSQSAKSEKVEPVKSKSHKPIKLSRNPFINFLRDFRASHQKLNAKEIVIQGAVEWQKMSEIERYKYAQQATNAPKRKPIPKRRHRSPSSASIVSSTGSETDASSHVAKKKRNRPNTRAHKTKTARLTKKKPEKRGRVYERRHNVASNNFEPCDGDRNNKSGSLTSVNSGYF